LPSSNYYMSFLYHITAVSTWEAAQKKGNYDFDSLKSDGFIHCSLREQVASVANRRFRSRNDLILLQIDESKITAPVKYENLEGGHEKFPHIYGPLNLDAVIKVFPFEPDSHGEFSPPERRSNPNRITIVEMTPEEFVWFQKRSLDNYAMDIARSHSIPMDQARAAALKQHSEIIPQGMKTPRHFFYSIRDPDKNSIGVLWWAVCEVMGKECCFVYDIFIEEQHRGKTYGSQALRWLELQAKALAIDDIRLHVFGHNPDAQRLYTKIGFNVISVQMTKKLG
jgi:uncharacterized protein (DUF952 family)/GNAT superfamily N-acetyltransferase